MRKSLTVKCKCISIYFSFFYFLFIFLKQKFKMPSHFNVIEDHILDTAWSYVCYAIMYCW